jgi:hypothetical protein
MRSYRALCGMAVLILLAAFPGPVRADTPAGEPTPSDSSAASGPFIIRTEKGEAIEVRYVGYWTADVVRYRTLSGETRYLTANRIRSVEDASGRDFLKSILRDRSSRGSPFADGGSGIRPPQFFWRGRPLPECSSYLVTEIGFHRMINRNEKLWHDSNVLVTADLGYMVNRSERTALGGLIHFGTESDRTGAGLGFRYRRWLSKSSAADFTAGVDFLGSVDPGGELGAACPWIEADVSIVDLLGLSIRGERWTGSIPPSYLDGSAGSKSYMTWHVGAKGGSYIGASAVAGGLLIVIVALSSPSGWL